MGSARVLGISWRSALLRVPFGLSCEQLSFVQIKKFGGTGWIGAFGEHGNPPHSCLTKVEGCARDRSRDLVIYAAKSPGDAGEEQLSENGFDFLVLSVQANFSDRDHRPGSF